MKYRVAKIPPFFYTESMENDYGCPHIEFDSKEQFEHISMTSSSYKMLQAKYDCLFDYFVRMMDICETAKHILFADGKIEQKYMQQEDDDWEDEE